MHWEICLFTWKNSFTDLIFLFLFVAPPLYFQLLCPIIVTELLFRSIIVINDNDILKYPRGQRRVKSSLRARGVTWTFVRNVSIALSCLYARMHACTRTSGGGMIDQTAWYRSRAEKGSETRCTLLHRLAKPFSRSPERYFNVTLDTLSITRTFPELRHANLPDFCDRFLSTVFTINLLDALRPFFPSPLRDALR